MTRRLSFMAILMCAGMTAPAQAQFTVPAVTIADTTPGGAPISAAEALAHVMIQATRASNAVSFGQLPAQDSINTVLAAEARGWVSLIDAHDARVMYGIQVASYGMVNVIAQQDAIAQQHIATRLAIPGLSVADKGNTYRDAVLAFLIDNVPSRLAVAEQYMTALDAMGPRVATQQFVAHRQLARAYYRRGQPADVIRHGHRAIACLAHMDFFDRSEMFAAPEGSPFYQEFVDALAGEPNGAQKIAALNTTLTAAATPPPALLAPDSSYVWSTSGWLPNFQPKLRVAIRVGTQAQNVVGNYWVNVPAPGAMSDTSTMSVADGHIHILEFGEYSCYWCLASLAPLQRVQDRFPNVHVVFVTATEGSWAAGWWNRLRKRHN